MQANNMALIQGIHCASRCQTFGAIAKLQVLHFFDTIIKKPLVYDQTKAF